MIVEIRSGLAAWPIPRKPRTPIASQQEHGAVLIDRVMRLRLSSLQRRLRDEASPLGSMDGEVPYSCGRHMPLEKVVEINPDMTAMQARRHVEAPSRFP